MTVPHSLLPAICPICQGRVADRSLQVHQESRRVECLDCGVQFWWPLERASAEWYAMWGSTTADWDDSLLRPGHRRFLASPPLHTGRLLDIGCGHGLFLEQVRSRAGIDVWGLDWDTGAIEFGRRVRHLDHLYCMPLEEFSEKIGGERFDAISLFEIVEHQSDPVAFLRQACGFLKPGGVLVGSVPNRTRWIIGAREEWDFPPQHLFWFHATSLATALQKAGLVAVAVTPLLDVPVLVNQLMARFSFGVASRLVRMPERVHQTVHDLPPEEFTRIRSQRASFGYRTTTTLKKLLLVPLLLPVVAGAALLPSARHTLYFCATMPRKGAAS